MQIRLSFKRNYCRTLQLPSGKWSDYDLYPITDTEVANLTADIDNDIPKGSWLTRDEYLLWVALRRKYGINYLKPKPQQTLAHIDSYFSTPDKHNELDELEAKMMFYCDGRIIDAIRSMPQPEPVVEDKDTEEKNFRSALDNPDFDVLY